MWETVIGLEVHVQLGTRTKLFCGCPAAFGDEPNTNVCPVCLGLPGALPVTNELAVRLAVRAALSLDFTVHPRSVFARKNYFYPDLPKGYQISQFDQPLATKGRLAVDSPDRGAVTIGITRLHIEEDAGKSIHDRFPEHTALDFNRTGVPLAEIVTEPDLRSPAEARAFLVALKQILEYVEVSDCNMEEGHLRVDANLSVRPEGAVELGTKQEVKNMNSFAAVERALALLRERQIESLEAGEDVTLDTYTAATGQLKVMRSKEESHDYRYFPDPDLPALTVSESLLRSEREALPELPAAKRDRLQHQYGLREYDAQVLSNTPALGEYFESVAASIDNPEDGAKWVMGVVLRDVNEHHRFRVAPARLASLIGLVGSGAVSNQAAKKVFAELTEKDADPERVAARLGLTQVADEEQLAAWVDAVIDRHPREVERFRGGEEKLIGFFVGRVMKESGGRADPKGVGLLVRSKLGAVGR